MVSLVISFIGLLASLALVEICYRLLAGNTIESVVPSERPATYYLPHDAKTLQDFPYSKTKSPDTFRIAVVGDSFSFAPHMQFDDAFPKRLERLLGLSEGKAEVINFGVPGYSTHHEVMEVKKALKYQPDFVLLQITLNDVQEKPYQPTGLRREHGFGNFSTSSSLLHYWQSLEFVMSRLHNSATHERYVNYYFELFESQSNWKSFQSSLASIARRGKKKEIPVYAVVFPLFGLPLDEHYPFHPLHTKIRESLNRVGIPMLDLFEAFQGIPLERIQLIPGSDFHPNEIGHRLAAEHIFEWFRDSKMIPSSLVTEARYEHRIDITGRSHLEKTSGAKR